MLESAEDVVLPGCVAGDFRQIPEHQANAAVALRIDRRRTTHRGRPKQSRPLILAGGIAATSALAGQAAKGMGMTGRAMWKADICLDSMRMPVKLYAAVQDTATHFRLLDKTDLTPVKQQMVDRATNSPVSTEDIQRGVQVERGVFVMITEEERANLEPPPSRDIVIKQVIKRTVVDDRWFDRPYFLGPDGDPERYFALAEALADGDEIAVAQWVMRSQRYAGVLHPDQGYLMISTFRHAEEMAQIDRIRPEPGRLPDKRELALADQLISALEDTFDPHAYKDEYRERVQDFLRQRAAGKTVRFPKAQTAKSDDRSLLQSLEASVKQGKREPRATKKR